MFKSKFRNEIVDVLKNIVFLNSYDEDLIGICLYGFYDDDNDLELICFYKDLDTKEHETFSNTYLIGDTYIKSTLLDSSRLLEFNSELSNGVIIYDPKSILSKTLNKSIVNGKKYIHPTNEIAFDNEFVKALIDSIILDKARKKDDKEKYTSILNIYINLVSCLNNFNSDEMDLFLETMLQYNKMYMQGSELDLHEKALTQAVKTCKDNKKELVKKIES